MPRITTPGAAEVEVRYIWNGQAVENVLHFHRGTDYDVDGLNNLAADVAAWAIANLIPLQTAICAFTEVLATDLSSNTGPQVSYTTGLPVVGTDGSGSQPNNVTVAVKAGTDSRGRSFRGRTYFIGLCLNEVIGSTLTSTALAAIKAAYEALRDYPFTDGSSKWVVLSEVHNNAPRANGVTTDVTTVSVDPTTDSQRRRLPGRGR